VSNDNDNDNDNDNYDYDNHDDYIIGQHNYDSLYYNNYDSAYLSGRKYSRRPLPASGYRDDRFRRRGITGVYGSVNNVDLSKIRVAPYACTDRCYPQPYLDNQFVHPCSNGVFSHFTHPWKRMIECIVDETFVPMPGPSIDGPPSMLPGVIVCTEQPPYRRFGSAAIGGQ